MVLLSAHAETDPQLLAWRVSRAWVLPAVCVHIPPGKELQLWGVRAGAWGVAAAAPCSSPCLCSTSSLTAGHVITRRKQQELISSTSLFIEREKNGNSESNSRDFLWGSLVSEPLCVVYWDSLTSSCLFIQPVVCRSSHPTPFCSFQNGWPAVCKARLQTLLFTPAL